jgi:hypothetical protein
MRRSATSGSMRSDSAGPAALDDAPHDPPPMIRHMQPNPTPIPQLAHTELEAYDLDVRHRTFEVSLRAIEFDRARRFVLRCTGIRQFAFGFDDPGGESQELLDVTEVHYTPTPDGATRVVLELWVERGRIELTCASFEVTERPGSAT